MQTTVMRVPEQRRGTYEGHVTGSLEAGSKLREPVGDLLSAFQFPSWHLVPHPFCASFAHASFSVMVRLKTDLPGALSFTLSAS